MNTPLISIVVPAYNIEPHVGRCLESLQAQTYSNIEIIVVDDGSTDGTGVVIDAYAAGDPRIVALHKDNGGVSSARIRGIQAATGAFIGFVDGDDYVEPEMFTHLLKNALEYDADISHCGYQMVFPDGHIDYYYATGKMVRHSHAEGIRALIKGDYVEPGLCNKLFRREVVIGFEQSSLWDSAIRINEDLLMNYILFSRAEDSVYEDIPYYHYILRKGSAATSEPKRFKIQDPVQVMKTILDDTENDETSHALAAERYLRVLISTAQQEYWKEDASDARKELKRRLRSFRKLPGVSGKVLLMAFGAAYLQGAYRLVRAIYNKFTGIDKKYSLE